MYPNLGTMMPDLSSSVSIKRRGVLALHEKRLPSWVISKLSPKLGLRTGSDFDDGRVRGSTQKLLSPVKL